MAITKSIRLLCELTWPTGAVSRLWDGAGPFMDGSGDIWSGCSLLGGLDEIEQAINGESTTINMVLTGVGEVAGNLVWLGYSDEQIVGAIVRLLIQPCDENDQPIDDREVVFTGRIDNKLFDDAVVDERLRSTITGEVTNRFTLRTLKSGSVLSDADQRARSAALNPGEDPDRFCERVPQLEDKYLTWPRWQ